MKLLFLSVLGFTAALCLLLTPARHGLALREAVPEINDFGWKFLSWGMQIDEVRHAFQKAGQPFATSPCGSGQLLLGFTTSWNPVELPALFLDKNGMCLSTTFHDAQLFFLQERLVGVCIDRSSPQHIQDALFQAMQRRYPEASHATLGQGRYRFQHYSGNRRIVWDSRPTGFTLVFYDPELLSRMGVHIPSVHGASGSFADDSGQPPPIAPLPPAPAASPQIDLQPLGTRWNEPATGIQFIFLPGGCFHKSLHAPPTCVKSLWISVNEVTAAQFAVFNASNAAPHAPNDERLLPARNMSRDRALDFSDWLSRMHPERSFALPTDAQWEYAARADQQGSAPWSTPSSACEWGNFAQSAPPSDESPPCSERSATVAPVGSYKANAWGLNDTLGNVWEWCFPEEDSPDFNACGGSFKTPVTEVGYFSRQYAPLDKGRDDVGLRLIMRITSDAPPSPTKSTAEPGLPVAPQPPTPPGGGKTRPAIEDLM